MGYLLQTGIYWSEVFIADRHLLERGLYYSKGINWLGIYCRHAFIGVRYSLQQGHLLERGIYFSRGIYWSEVFITCGAFIGERYLFHPGHLLE